MFSTFLSEKKGTPCRRARRALVSAAKYLEYMKRATNTRSALASENRISATPKAVTALPHARSGAPTRAPAAAAPAARALPAHSR